MPETERQSSALGVRKSPAIPKAWKRQRLVMLTFGPLPSRRFGRSLGITNIPRKSCTYSCVYCQVGPTPETKVDPRGRYQTGGVLVAGPAAPSLPSCQVP